MPNAVPVSIRTWPFHACASASRSWTKRKAPGSRRTRASRNRTKAPSAASSPRRLAAKRPAFAWLSVARRSSCLVRWEGGVWIHHYRGAKIPHAGLGRAAPPDVFMAEARNIFLHGYRPRPGDNVFDIGAGVGAETLLFSRL